VKGKAFTFALIAILAAAGGFLAAMLLNPGASEPQPERLAVSGESARPAAEIIGSRRPDFSLRDTDGNVVSASDFDGQVLLLNFWASWCKPCVEEMPMLSLLQQEHASRKLQVLGIALDDAERAKEFTSNLALAYPVLVGQVDVVLTGRRYGNSSGMLPFSVLVDAAGIIQWTHLGSLNRADLEREINRLGI